jgi:hypothetical protein
LCGRQRSISDYASSGCRKQQEFISSKIKDAEYEEHKFSRSAVNSSACQTAPPSIQTGPDAELSYDGLHIVDNSQADVAWARPDLDLSGYTKIMPASAGIEYRQVKNKGRTSVDRSRGGPYFIDDKARGKFEKLVAEVFIEELQKSERFTVVGEPGPDVLIIWGALLDVISYVPPDPVGGRSEVFLTAVGGSDSGAGIAGL